MLYRDIVSILAPWPMDWLPYWTVVALHAFCFGHHVLLVSWIDFPPSFLLIQLVPLPLFKRSLFCALYVVRSSVSDEKVRLCLFTCFLDSACATLPVFWILFSVDLLWVIFCTFLTGSSVSSPLDIFSFCTIPVLLTFCFESAIKSLFDCIRSAFGSLSANLNITNWSRWTQQTRIRWGLV